MTRHSLSPTVPATILVGVGTGGIGCASKSGSVVTRSVGAAVKAMDVGGNAVGACQSAADIYQNGADFSNTTGLISNSLGIAGNLGSKCFTAGTQVVVGMEQIEDASGNLTTVYTTANIEDIKVGDLVYSYDTTTGEVSQKAVTDTFVRESDHLNYLTITDENGHEQTIESTDGHPFWVVSSNPDTSRAARDYVFENGLWLEHENLDANENGHYVEAKDLKVGDVFLGANGKLSTLTNKVRVEQAGGIAVFNFTVEGNHNYFVLEKDFDYGQTCVLVHNAGAWYHGTDAYSADDILKNGLNQAHMKDVIGDVNKGFYVTDDITMAKGFADLRGMGKPGTVLEFLDDDIGDLLVGDGTKIHEAVISFGDFGKVTPAMIKRYVE